MKKLFYLLAASALLCAGIFIGACDSSSGAIIPIPVSNYQQRTINANSSVTATAIDLFTELNVSVAADGSAVNVTPTPANANVKVWCDTDVVSFVGEPAQAEGTNTWPVKFKPNKIGSFVFTAESGSVTKTLTIKVTSRAASIQITGSSSPLDVGKTVQLTANVKPANSESKIQWHSSNDNVAAVDQNGLVTAKKAGKATIFASAINDQNNSFGVSGYFDVTVKGFYLSDDYFFLCLKDLYDEVEANVIGIESGTVEWQSSDTNLFTVENDSTDPGNDKKKRLIYKDGASGTGTLTATLTSGGQTYTATALVVVEKLSMLALGDSIAAGYASEALGPEDKDMEEPAMIEAYKKYMNRRKDASIDPDYVNEYCYSAVFAKNYSQLVNTKLLSYARSGDQTKDLIEKLKPGYRDAEVATKQGEILEAVQQADFITLCIGANDILQRATGMNLLFQDLDWFRTTFTQDLATFKTNFDSILATLTAKGQLLYVMSVYSPYHYFTLENIPA